MSDNEYRKDGFEVPRQLKEWSKEDWKVLEDYVDLHPQVKIMIKRRQAYEIVANTVRVSLIWLATIIGAVIFLKDILIDLLKSIV